MFVYFSDCTISVLTILVCIIHVKFFLCLDCIVGYNFEVWEVEPPCTHVKAETGDKALMSWWAVKLGRNQQMNKIWNSRYLDQLDYLTQCEFIAAIFRLGLLKEVQARGGSRSRPQSLNHDPLEQSSVRLCHGTKTSCLGVPTRVPITKSLPSFSTSIWREHYIIVC